jgi:ribose transport system substrate-binding protein
MRRKRWFGFAWAAMILALAALTAVGCGDSGSTSAGDGGSDAGGGSTAQESDAATAPAETGCGSVPKYTLDDPDNLVAKLPEAAQELYKVWPYKIAPTPWADFKGKPGPWKLGLITFPLNSPYMVDLVKQVKEEFNKAKDAGLVTGSLETYIQPSFDTATPEQQIAAIQQMVRKGIDGIMIMPLAGEPLAPAIDAAGKAGVPVVVMDNVVPNSKYVVNAWANKQAAAAAGTAGQVKKGDALIVRGVPGNTVEKAINDATVASIKSCPGIKVVDEIYGQWAAPSAKAAVLKWLSANPGKKLDAVFQNGAMAAGVYDAFESLNKDMPVVSEGGCQGADLSWWLAHKDTYETKGTCDNGFQVGYGRIRLLMRVLQGNGLKLRDISIPTPYVTNENLAEFATPNKALTWTGEPKGPIDSGCGSQECLDQFFDKPSEGALKGF